MKKIKIELTEEQQTWLLRFFNMEWNNEVEYQSQNNDSDTSYLEDMLDVFGDREIVLARELTKTFEEYIKGKISSVLKEENIKGEIVLIVEGYKESNISLDNPYDKIDELINMGYKPIEAIKEVSKLFNLDRKELYKDYVQSKNNK